MLRWDRRLRLLPEAIQSPAGQRLLAGLTPEARLATAHAVTAEGVIHSGGAAAAPICEVLPAGAPVARLARLLGGPAQLGYGWVAANRTRLSRLVPARAKEGAAEAIERHRRRVLDAG